MCSFSAILCVGDISDSLFALSVKVAKDEYNAAVDGGGGARATDALLRAAFAAHRGSGAGDDAAPVGHATSLQSVRVGVRLVVRARATSARARLLSCVLFSLCALTPTSPVLFCRVLSCGLANLLGERVVSCGDVV